MSNKLPRADVQRAIQETVRAFPNRIVDIHRPRRVQQTALGQKTLVMDSTTLIYRGEAIFYLTGETVIRLALGAVEQSVPLLVLPTVRDVVPTDIVVIDRYTYEVTGVTDIGGAGTVINLKKYQQGLT
jgi:hypothetical protein